MYVLTVRISSEQQCQRSINHDSHQLALIIYSSNLVLRIVFIISFQHSLRTFYIDLRS